MTIASWPAGSVDDQQPHEEDEVYYVAHGKAMLEIDDQDHEVAPGSIVYVAAHVHHRFHGIAERLVVLVFWSPPRASA
jgi:mannose-6-phosphate isomerase-like protein (cupin superfamily)